MKTTYIGINLSENLINYNDKNNTEMWKVAQRLLNMLYLYVHNI